MSKKLSELVSIALERVTKGDKGFEFENFAQKISRCKHGDSFFATSPFKDGGIDGFIARIEEDYIITKRGVPNIIFQYGTTVNFSNKIRSTYNDLKLQNITIKKLNYFTPHAISQITKRIDELEEELDISITIIDQTQFVTMASNNECTSIFKEFVATIIGSLDEEDDKSIALDYPALYLSAWYKYENKSENNKTITNVADSLIIWALRNTNPEEKIFMSKEEIYESIEKEFPTAKNTIKSIFDHRVEYLRSTKTQYSRETIQKHKQGFCLPLETREDFLKKNEESKNILLLAKNSFKNRILENNMSDETKNQIIELLLHSVKHVFTKQGIKLTKNIIDDDEDSYDDIYLRDSIEEASLDIHDKQFTNKEKEIVSKILRAVFANPTIVENDYLVRSCHLYMMHYIMHNNMDIISYFEERTKRLTLIVHSDIIILALSEHYLPKEGQHYRNMLAYLIEKGSELVITEETLTEVYMQLHIASLSYKNDINAFESHFDIDSVRFIPVLMTRAYMYNKLDNLVKSWDEFINNFCKPSNILNKSNMPLAKEELKIYLTDKFKFDILSSVELRKNIDTTVADELSKILEPHKKKPIIAEHIANVNIYVSTIRKRNKEISKNPFGYKTYWLTREKRLYNFSKEFFDKNELERRTIMRPEFIMEQMIFTPDKDSIAKSYTATFPTALGIQMSQQLSVNAFKQIMSKLEEISKHDDSRAKAILNEVIQVAAESTNLNYNTNVYEHELLDDCEKLSAKINIEEIFKKAENNKNNL
ncbi:hypothetical protein [Aliarcobacter butzleri]|uniref:hypothetical protein n=1 Tax=Aliarcobacter butzleri TaxID=28197 RepID=UPI0021B1B77B|nr:hypothetical protein [Aliarcobacter butzleri]MCT7620507.1 hypothetical protein [Aliarcobacter butzleri]